jgi:outer membrane protein OmpA-like peptidoglycan-associated protein
MTRLLLPMTAIALAMLAGCSTIPANNASLDSAHSEYRTATADPQVRDLATSELRQAADALAKADAAHARREEPGAVDHLAYLARQRTAIAQQTAHQRAAEATVSSANTDRDQLRLASRTREADAAHMKAQQAQGAADASQRQSEASQAQAAMSQQQAGDAERRNATLEAALRDLNASKTDRGMVITLGDVLFDTNRAQLKSGGTRSVEKLAGFLKDNPGRKALIEGFTDSTGSDSSNQQLSGRRADAVRTAMVGMGVSSERISTHGYGEAYPVAGNETAGGRQMNRRVEIIVSDEGGSVTPR